MHNLSEYKPEIHSSEATLDFFQGLVDRKLLLQYCPHCKKYSLTSNRFCPYCLSAVIWKEVNGEGTIYTWTTNYQNSHPAFTAEIPYVIGTILLKENVLFIARVFNSEQVDLKINMSVKVNFWEMGNTYPIPVFEPLN
jgi:Predicted nucleic-acid-binding protein containing a Zn-ribbon